MNWMLRKLSSLFYELRHRTRAVFTISFLNGIIIKGYNMSITIRNDQEVTLTPVFKDKSGNAVTVLGSVPVWSVSDQTVAVLAVAADGLSAVVTFPGTLGEVLVSMIVDADPDAGVVEVAAQQHITVIAGMGLDVTLAAVVTDVAPAEVAVPVVVPVPEVVAEPVVVAPVPVVTIEPTPVFVPTFPPAEQTFEHTPETALVAPEVVTPVVVAPVEVTPAVEPVVVAGETVATPVVEVAPSTPVEVVAPVVEVSPLAAEATPVATAEAAPVEAAAVATGPAAAEPVATTVAEQALGNPAI